MNVQSPVRMEKQAFLTWVQSQEERYELDRGRVLMMTGGSRAHWQITLNLAKALDARLPSEKYSVLPEFGVDLETGSIRFPDVVVDAAGESPKDLTATAPLLIAETVWHSEAALWRDTAGLRVVQVLGSPSRRLAALDRPADVYVINYDNLKWLAGEVDKRRLTFSVLVADESSKLKTPTAQRTRIMLAMAGRAELTALLTDLRKGLDG